MSILSKLRKILGILTDILIGGREQGWWKRGQKLPQKRKRK